MHIRLSHPTLAQLLLFKKIFAFDYESFVSIYIVLRVTMNYRLEDELETPLPLESVAVRLPRDIFCKLPPFGTVLRLTLNCGNEKLGMNVLRTNRWVKFDNLRCQLLDSLWHAAHLPTTRFCYLRDEDHIVSQRMRFSSLIFTYFLVIMC